MALDDFKTDEVNLSTRRRIENVNLPKEAWGFILIEERKSFHHVAEYLEDNDIKAIINHIDDELDSSRPFDYKPDGDMAEDMRDLRDKLFELLKERKSD